MRIWSGRRQESGDCDQCQSWPETDALSQHRTPSQRHSVTLTHSVTRGRILDSIVGLTLQKGSRIIRNCKKILLGLYIHFFHVFVWHHKIIFHQSHRTSIICSLSCFTNLCHLSWLIWSFSVKVAQSGYPQRCSLGHLTDENVKMKTLLCTKFAHSKS